MGLLNYQKETALKLFELDPLRKISKMDVLVIKSVISLLAFRPLRKPEKVW